MAANTTKGRKTGSNRTNSRSGGTRGQSNKAQIGEQEKKIGQELLLLGLFAAVVILFLCNFGIIGPFGDAISGVLFGFFGVTAYLAPILIFGFVAFGISNQGNFMAMLKLGAGIAVFLIVMTMMHLIQADMGGYEGYSPALIYELGRDSKAGGGIIGGSFAWFLYSFLDTSGTILILLVLFLASLIILTGKSFVSGMKKNSSRAIHSAKEDVRLKKEKLRDARIRQQELREEKKRREEEDQGRREAEKILRMDKKVSGVMLDTNLKQPPVERQKHEDIHEITIQDYEREFGRTPDLEPAVAQEDEFEFGAIRIHSADRQEPEEIRVVPEPLPVQQPEKPRVVEDRPKASKPSREPEEDLTVKPIHKSAGNRPYQFPPISCLIKSSTDKKQSGNRELKETALRLQQTLATFGVKVTITDISQGPSVTRYELQPEQGVKVSKVVGLADDIKLNLAATDIRIEAPIPGKAAIGIEVPNKENTAVGLRELLESRDYKEFPSKLAFAVGKDIAGKVVVTDIAKMPHMLIAGATGSGKSVCINTLIMSLLYKASPEEVKLIMIDPKVVELSVYNGIPHLLIPVVTDPKKAAGALHWGVAEMTDRYQKFADFNVRDLKGYNAVIEQRLEKGEADVPPKMPQIVIIVDELADLMMVAPGEVEESICRLAQLARAAGIHLIIATQRPSVDVITGLIKANMPSRVAFAVSSGVDSRTILDMNGAEKLLGKGDMLFYPQGYPKPARMQGAFVSDREVSDVVDFLKNQTLGNVYNEEIEDKIRNIGSSSSGSGSSGGESQRDSYFIEAGRFIIEKDKASIGMLQRVFKIGFNRAARIMDQLADAGVVGEEEGTKPRKVLMSMEQFESYIEEMY